MQEWSACDLSWFVLVVGHLFISYVLPLHELLVLIQFQNAKKENSKHFSTLNRENEILFCLCRRVHAAHRSTRRSVAILCNSNVSCVLNICLFLQFKLAADKEIDLGWLEEKQNHLRNKSTTALYIMPEPANSTSSDSITPPVKHYSIHNAIEKQEEEKEEDLNAEPSFNGKHAIVNNIHGSE